MSLGDHDAAWDSNYFYTEDVMELLHVLHFESTGEEFLDMVDIYHVLSSNDQVVDIYYDEYLSSGVASDEQGIVGLAHVEADLMKVLCYL